MGSKGNIESNKSSVGSLNQGAELDDCCKPEFIYGGPFIKAMKIEPFLDTATPVNLQLSGTFKKSFAYYSLKERLPVILTKVIDGLSKIGSEDAKSAIKSISKLKNDLVTNRNYDLLTEDSTDAKKWNQWLVDQEQTRYFNNTWVFTECYVYRRLKEACVLTKTLKDYDPFADQKDKSFADSLEPMCIVADKMKEMLPQSDKDKRKADLSTLLKLSLWANKCDLSLTLGSAVTIGGSPDGEKGKSNAALDPLQMIIDCKDKLLVDDTGKIADLLANKSDAMAKAIAGPPEEPSKAAPSNSPPPSTPAEGEEAEAPKIPCPAKMVIPQCILFDIICDNAGYELFTDLCIAHFLVSQNLVQKVRFHVKNMPWFVSDVTRRDFQYVINACTNASYNRTIQSEPKPDAPEGETEQARTITSDSLRELGQQWNALVEDGTFIVMSEPYWTWPHCYKDMKKYDYNLYRKLQYAIGLLFKGDLNYRKLIGEKNWIPTAGFEPALQGFIPAPIIAVRTIKADLVCGLPKGKAEQIAKIDDKWMEKGDYGVIQLCSKAEPLKVSEKPCLDYCDLCFGEGCPVHNDM